MDRFLLPVVQSQDMDTIGALIRLVLILAAVCVILIMALVIV
jgi:hypothetical protein